MSASHNSIIFGISQKKLAFLTLMTSKIYSDTDVTGYLDPSRTNTGAMADSDRGMTRSTFYQPTNTLLRLRVRVFEHRGTKSETSRLTPLR